MVYMSVPMDTSQTKRLNLRLQDDIDTKLREIAERTGLKLVTVISQGIEHEYREWKAASWGKATGAEKGEAR